MGLDHEKVRRWTLEEIQLALENANYPIVTVPEMDEFIDELKKLPVDPNGIEIRLRYELGMLKKHYTDGVCLISPKVSSPITKEMIDELCDFFPYGNKLIGTDK